MQAGGSTPEQFEAMNKLYESAGLSEKNEERLQKLDDLIRILATDISL